MSFSVDVAAILQNALLNFMKKLRKTLEVLNKEMNSFAFQTGLIL